MARGVSGVIALLGKFLMCGFAGFLGDKDGPFLGWQSVLDAMGNSIAHRGPDDEGIWMDAGLGLGLVHRRLSILELSPAGHQPMISGSGRYVIVFNGEIYNHLDLRRELEAASSRSGLSSGVQAWRGRSDTETLLAGFDVWGIEATVVRSVGMFAFAVLDRQSRTLTLGRDRLGEKPLYYGWQGCGAQDRRGASIFLFGSELKALKEHPAFEGDINRDAIALLLRHGYIPAPHSIYNGVFKLPPGHLLTVPIDGHDSSDSLPVKYWTLKEVASEGLSHRFADDEKVLVGRLDGLMKQAVAGQMLADVPLGAFLSGGVDSSAIVALMQEQSGRAVKTFTIGFNEEGYNEAAYAKSVARHLGTDHTELYVSAREAMDVIPKLPALYDEPFSDSSQIPTFLVSQLAKAHVSVALSGDGGDELFGGYSRYRHADRAWRSIGRVPSSVRQLMANAIRTIPVPTWNALSFPVRSLLPARMRNVGDKAHKFADMMGHRDLASFYHPFLTFWDDPSSVVLRANAPPINSYDASFGLEGSSHFDTMMATDTAIYLPDDILAKVDRAAMGVSLETRVPLLDHRLVEFAWRLPLDMKIRDGQGKWILRQVLHRYVPKALIDRPKMGFGVPIGTWLRGPLRDWAESLLDASRLREEGFFNPTPIREKWLEHLSGQRNWQYHLWSVLMFQSWLERERTR